MVFYIKNNPKQGSWVYKFYQDIDSSLGMSTSLKNDLLMVFALASQLGDQEESALEIYESFLKSDDHMRIKGMFLNNYGVLL